MTLTELPTFTTDRNAQNHVAQQDSVPAARWYNAIRTLITAAEMVSPPRTREFYRPILEDIHEAARGWRESLSRLHFSQLLFVAGILLAGPVLTISLIMYSGSHAAIAPEIENAIVPGPAPAETDIATIPVVETPEANLMRALEEQGARFGHSVQGPPTWIILEGEQFTDRDLEALSSIRTLESVTIIDAVVTDDGLRTLRLPALQQLTLVNSGVTEEAAEAYPGMIGPQNVTVQLIREFGPE